MKNDNKNTAIILVCGVVFMSSLAYAAVPIYRIFCQKTGYGGTVMVGKTNKGIVLNNRFIEVKFNGDVNPELPWEFEPLQPKMKIKLGENALAFYKVRNNAIRPVSGIAVYNVTPEKAAVYFSKVQCFCFIEQILPPGKWIDMPVQFFIDPDLAKDPNLKEVSSITLSYTFFPTKRTGNLKPSITLHQKEAPHV